MALHVWQATIVNERGDILSGATVEVRYEGTGALARIYSDSEGEHEVTNPMAVADDGFARFYTTAGRYRITAAKGGYSRAWRHVEIGHQYALSPAEAAAGVTPVDYLYPELDVQRYGDDRAAIAAAIAVATQKGGGTIALKEGGSYTVTSDIDIVSGSQIIIDGRGATVTASSRQTQLFQITGSCEHVVIRNLKWHPPAYAGSGSGQARMVLINGSVDCLEIDHCTVTNGALVTSEAPSGGQIRCNIIRITNCKADGQGNPSNGLQVGGYRQLFVDGCEITGYALDGIKLTISRVQDTYQLTDPFTTTSGSYRVTVAHAAHNMLDGDRVTFSNASAVGGITIDGTYAISRVIDSDSYEIIHTSAASSSATGGGTVDIAVKYPLTEMTSIKRCIFHNNDPGGPDSAIDIFGGGRHTVVEECEFHYLASGIVFKRENNGGGGTDLAGDVTRAVIAKNKFFGVGNPCYVRLADHCRIKDNYFERCGIRPITTNPVDTISVIGPLTDLEISGNTFVSNLGREIDIAVATVTGLALDEVHVTIRDNKFYDSRAICIHNTDAGASTRFLLDISSNWFIRHGAEAIELRGYGDSVFNIDKNFFVDSANDALDVATITATDLLNWGDNIFVDHASPGEGILGPSSGTYTPTLTNGANVASSIPRGAQYLRVGNVVTVSGRVDISYTSATTETVLGISLPIPTNFTNAWDCAGVAQNHEVPDQTGAIIADTANERAQLIFTSGTDTGQFHNTMFTFTYVVR